jgi:hypothetical protein
VEKQCIESKMTQLVLCARANESQC